MVFPIDIFFGKVIFGKYQQTTKVMQNYTACNELRVFSVISRLNRGSYMSAHVLLNLLNELGKRDKMRGLPSILSLFRNEFNKFNNTGARM